MRKLLMITIALAITAVSCSQSEGASTTSTFPTTTSGGGISVIAERFDPSSIRFEAALERFDQCDGVLEHFIAEALERVGPYGLDGAGGPIVFAEEEMAFAGGDDAAAPATTTATATVDRDGSEFSGTNVQVFGVDEPDVIKTDGNRIIAIVERKLYYVDVSGAVPELVGSLYLGDAWGHTMFVNGDRAFVFATGYGIAPMPVDAASSFIPPFGETTVIQEIDLSDPADLSVTRSMIVEGRFLSARSIDGTGRIVLSSFPAEIAFVYPSGPAAEAIAEEANREIVRNSTLEDWLPNYTLLEGDDVVAEGLLAACDAVHAPAEFAGFNSISVLTVDFDEGLGSADAVGVIADGETVYASTESLYVATNVWVPGEWIGDVRLNDFEEQYSTAVHKFDISGDGPAAYRASGSVSGHLLNQFSMDEYEGNLRIATTDGPPWGFDESESFVVVLEEQGDRLVEIGRVGEMGRGERIFSVRFIGDVAYVVTFRQTDPLYVVDLTDPTNPSVTGELKIPGYSAYLHPIGDGRLIGVGQEATDEGFTIGAKVSMFDVSDPANPRELDTWVLEGGYTEVEWDHHAFLYWAAEDLAVLPLQNWSTGFSGAVALRTDDGLREIGRITHELGAAAVPSDCTEFEIPEEFYEPGLVVQLCGSSDIGGYGAHYCEVIPADEAAMFVEEFTEIGVDIESIMEDDDRIEICFPDYDDGRAAITRSLVIGDSLWTLSWRALQANALDTLDVEHTIGLG
jgi:hypothetical protein